MQYPTAWPTVAKEVLVVQGKQTILLTTLINRKQEIKIFPLTLVKPLPTTVTFTSWNRWRNISTETRSQSFWLNRWITWTVKSNGTQKTICPLPLSKSIFNNLRWRNQHRLMRSSRHSIQKVCWMVTFMLITVIILTAVASHTHCHFKPPFGKQDESFVSPERNPTWKELLACGTSICFTVYLQLVET